MTASMFSRYTHRQVFTRYLADREERQLFGTVDRIDCPLARRDAAWMRLIRHTGIRVGSLAALTLADARRALIDGELVIADDIAKGRRGYSVALSKAARAALQTLQRTRRAMGLSMEPDSALVPSRRGAPLSVRSYQARMRYWCEQAGLSVEASPHWLRHTLGQRIMRQSTARDPQQMVQIALGQRSRQSTQVYTLPTREDVALAMEEAS